MRPFRDRKAHLAKNRDDFVDGLADRVDAAGPGERDRQGYVGALTGEPFGEGRTTEARSLFEQLRSQSADPLNEMTDTRLNDALTGKGGQEE